jgi:hypothetical protein
VEDAATDWITEQVLQPLARGDEIAPAGLAFLLRRYAETGRDDIGDALGGGLRAALETSSLAEADLRSDWLLLLVDVTAISDDDRLSPRIVELASQLRRDWPSRGDVASAMQSIDACLIAASALPDLLDPREIVPAAVDELERVVHAAYQPGEGMAHALGGAGETSGTLADHVASANALLTAYAVAGRLPYAMLAEELMQYVRRTNATPERSDVSRFIAQAQAVRVLCRLAKLREDDDYREASVSAEKTDYAGDAKRQVAALAPVYREFGADAAVYGLALEDVRGLR